MTTSTPSWRTLPPAFCWKTIGYAMSNDAAMAEIPKEELIKADVNPIDTTLLAQTPIDSAMRDRMLQEFEQIKAGF